MKEEKLKKKSENIIIAKKIKKVNIDLDEEINLDEYAYKH